MKKASFTLLTAALICSCNGGVRFQADGGIMELASHITVQETAHSYHVRIANPWKKGTLLHTYTFTDSLDTDYKFNRAGNTVHIPLKRVVVMTNSLARLMVEIGVQDCIAGVCEPEYISDSLIRARLESGVIADCGNSMYPTIEKIMELHPDAIMVSPFEQTGYGQLEKLGIPLLECADYMETSPLSRAEWIRFYGRLFGAAAKADSLYDKVSTDYNTLKDLAAGTVSRPKVMLDTRSGSAWYVAGGGSTIGRMIADAGAEYVFGDNSSSGSVPLSFETVFEKAQDADVWLLKNSSSIPLTYSLLESDFKSYASFKPFRERNIWVCNVNEVPYFELTSFHPEMLLGEFISIFHPEMGSGRFFYHPLQE
ncbi:MAG: ABC transporter substrate-binding protein [Bacteroidaceae bacterium]|nr:ABC transporter substrate-binding protein [Bacteroidaceae bacterium]MBP5647527.1 ABC transporter substrate-binding protein [Bacteroidaceae bacterium]